MTSARRELQIVRDGDGRPVVWSVRSDPDWTKPVAFLIHGYNVEQAAAAASYEKLLKLLGRVGRLPPVLENNSWTLFWPGYASGGLAPGKLAIRSALSYSEQVPSAYQGATALNDYIDEYSLPGGQITIIAHSLGCRLTLELLDMYATRSPTRVT